MEPRIEIQHDVPRTGLESTFTQFSPGCPEVVPVLVRVRESDPAMSWIRRRDIACWAVQHEIDGIRFAPKDQTLLKELEYEFGNRVVVIGPS